MDDLPPLAELINRRNLLEQEITALISRPAEIGHLGEYIASKVFNIELQQPASHKAIEGHFTDGLLKGFAVNRSRHA